MPDFDDAPIAKPEQDRFGFDPFARAIARCILALKHPVGSVVAIHGPWGSGKSSVINLVRHHLAQVDDAPVVVPIQAWWYRTEDALAVGFFRELYAALRDELDKTSGAKDALAALGGVVAGGGKLLGAVAGVFGGSLAETVVGGAAELVGNLVTGDETTDALQHKVAEALRAQPKRFLFIVDDLDRLTPDEALVVLRLIKSVGRLPNVAYLLSYDREVTEKVVADRYPSEGAHYLEKIVQAGFDLPEPDPVHLQTLFLEQVEPLFLKEDGGSWLDGDDTHLVNLFFEAIYPELGTPRDVVRLANSLAITWGAVKGEVHPGDFVALEALRLFRPAVYRAVRASEHRLVGTSGDDHQTLEQAKELEERLIGSVPSQDRQRIKNVLMRLFPRLQATWSNTRYSSGESWVRARRLCSSEHFDTYFVFSLPDHTIGREEIAALARRAGEPDYVQRSFREAIATTVTGGQTRASHLLEAMTLYADDVADKDVEPFLTALFEVADELRVPQDEAKAFGIADNRFRLHWLLRKLTLERMLLAERSRVILKASERAALSWLADLTISAHGDYFPRKGEDPESEERCLTTREDLDRLVALFLARMEAAAADGSLLATPKLAGLLFRWADFDGDDGAGVRAWTASILEDDAAVPVLAEAFLGTSWTQGMGFGGLGDLVARRSDRAQIDGAERIIDPVQFQARLEKLTATGAVDGPETEVMRRLLKAWNAPRR
ncbi:NTPase [Rubellimicrobium rubrum]|uniref:NTPase n=1 Tax=Rubellimicrobium rubrum TaxID=2585369 RepID=A0A5C4MN62_9RHOB|nr:P-loop NTPase fold protein [Rubellimicrobium rubrum]TNC45271.1 NTPase [Rubellimicrobium rubrum]